ncbi:hypothetical protein [Winogradskyella wichelsiae]|uniref:hypothetical protein n=1 Tax=Winogradskyella wichelsiae TaxID=2697007 RepID=UPI003EF736BA
MGNQIDFKPKEPRGNKDFIVEQLGFNDKQLTAFKEKSKGHHKIIIGLSDDVRVLKDQLFEKLSEKNVSESSIDSIASLISLKEKEKAKEVFYHFRMIQELSNDEQKEKFKMLIVNALRQGDQGRMPPPQRDGEGHMPPPRQND